MNGSDSFPKGEHCYYFQRTADIFACRFWVIVYEVCLDFLLSRRSSATYSKFLLSNHRVIHQDLRYLQWKSIVAFMMLQEIVYGTNAIKSVMRSRSFLI